MITAAPAFPVRADQNRHLAKFHRTRADGYRAELAKETHPALRSRWATQQRRHIRKAQALEAVS